MAKIAATRPAAGAPDIGAWLAARAWPAIRTTAAPAAIVLLALLLRVFRLELQAWTPDTYEQMTAAHRLVSGQLPVSGFYPPGVAIAIAPAFVLFPQTLATQQGVIIASALVLVAAVYIAARHATPDRIAPVLLALAVAAMPQLVYFSRDGFFDVMNAAWIAAAILIVPWLRGRSTPVFAVYGLLLAVTISIRSSNPAFLPAIVIYWAGVDGGGLRPRAVWRATFRRGPVAATAAMVVSFVFFALIGGALGHAATKAPFTLGHSADNASFYALAEFGDVLCAPLIIPLAALGATYLWRHNRPLLYVSVYMLTVFPLAHVPLPFANNRYMLPPMVFGLLLSAYAPAAIIELTARQPAVARNMWRALVAAPLLLLGAYMTAADATQIAHWPDNAARSDEAAYRQLRPVIRTLPSGSLVVSGGTRGVRDSNRNLEYLDLIDYSLPTDNGPQRVDEVMQRVQRALDQGRPTYYLYTNVEGINITFAASGPGYQPYFDAASQRFHLTEVFATDLKFFKLYKIDARD